MENGSARCEKRMESVRGREYLTSSRVCVHTQQSRFLGGGGGGGGGVSVRFPTCVG